MLSEKLSIRNHAVAHSLINVLLYRLVGYIVLTKTRLCKVLIFMLSIHRK